MRQQAKSWTAVQAFRVPQPEFQWSWGHYVVLSVDSEASGACIQIAPEQFYGTISLLFFSLSYLIPPRIAYSSFPKYLFLVQYY